MMSRIRNIKDLAEIAGVSTGTVSRALADSPLISDRTRTRIKALAAEHGFRPNALARNLRIQRTGAIGVLIPLGHEAGQQISEPFFITMLGLVADALSARGYDLLLSRVIPSGADWLDRFADTGRVDGLILIGQSDQWDAIERVAAAYHPLVVWGAQQAGQVHCSVGTDNALGGRLAARHLIERGCRRLAFFGDPRAIEIAQRLEGLRSAAAEAGLGADAVTVLPAHLVAEAATPAIARFLDDTAHRPDGILCASDVIAMSTLRALSEHGLAVPAEMRVVGFDGLPLGEQTVPRLTTVRQDLNRGAGLLVDKLVRRIGGEETAPITMPPELVVRMSS